MPSSSKKQHNFMAAIAHSPAFAKKVGVPQSVGKDFNEADKGKKFGSGGATRPDVQKVNSPKTVHSKMAIFSVIDTTDGGDTRYTGFVKDAANWAVAEAALSGATTEILVGGGEGSAPVFTTVTGTGAPVRATSPSLVDGRLADFVSRRPLGNTRPGGYPR